MKHKTSIATKCFLLPFFMVLLPIFSIAQSSHVTLLPGINIGGTIVRETRDYYILYANDTMLAPPSINPAFYIIEKPFMGNAYTSVPLPSNYLVKDFTIDNDEVYFVGEIGTVQSSVGFFSIPNVLGGVGTIEYFPFPTLPNITPYDPTASHQLTFGDFDRIRYFKDGIRGHLMVIGNMNDLIDNTYSIDTRCIIDCDLASQSLEFAYNYMDEEWFDDIIAMRDTVVLLARKGKPGSYLHPPIMRLFPRNPFSL